MLFSKRLKDLDMFSATKISTMHAYNDKALYMAFYGRVINWVLMRFKLLKERFSNFSCYFCRL